MENDSTLSSLIRRVPKGLTFYSTKQPFGEGPTFASRFVGEVALVFFYSLGATLA